MRVLILDEDFLTLGAISAFTSLIWTPRYTKIGCFELHATQDYFSLFQQGTYVYRNDREELGVIEELQYTQSESGEQSCYIKGNFAECLLYRKVIPKTVTFSGNLEMIMRGLVTDYAISPESGEAIAHLELGDLSGIETELTATQVTGENLSDYLYELGNTYDISHRVRYDYQADVLYFEVWQGKDRTDSQTDNSWAIFSNSFCNIRSVEYNKDTSSYANFAYVAGEGEDEERTVIEVDVRSSTDEERREIYVDARDLQSEDDDGNVLSDDEYTELLYERGLEKLEEYDIVETVSSDIDANANLVYREDFDIGDLCMYVNTELGIETEKRITEIVETYEGGEESITVTFGTDTIETVDEAIKRAT